MAGHRFVAVCPQQNNGNESDVMSAPITERNRKQEDELILLHSIHLLTKHISGLYQRFSTLFPFIFENHSFRFLILDGSPFRRARFV